MSGVAARLAHVPEPPPFAPLIGATQLIKRGAVAPCPMRETRHCVRRQRGMPDGQLFDGTRLKAATRYGHCGRSQRTEQRVGARRAAIAPSAMLNISGYRGAREGGISCQAQITTHLAFCITERPIRDRSIIPPLFPTLISPSVECQSHVEAAKRLLDSLEERRADKLGRNWAKLGWDVQVAVLDSRRARTTSISALLQMEV